MPIQEEAVIDAEHGTDIGFREPDVDPDVDCKCYWRVSSVENVPADQTSWSIFEIHPANNLISEINGTLQEWQEVGSPNLLPLPSVYKSVLPPPYNGWHTFYLASYGATISEAGADFTMNLEVQCFLQNSDGTETLYTTTHHPLVWNEADRYVGSEFAIFRREFSCYYLIEEEPTEPIEKEI